MHVVTAALLLLFITALSAPLGRVVRIPQALLQIALGVGAELCGARVGFEPDVFMLLFIPPLLFADAFRTPMRELRQLRWPILLLAVGLVLFTTLGGGAFVHWLIPPIPLGAAFALAAALSPTDAVAVGSMVAQRRVPPRFEHILAGEALLNDASGLVCFKFAVAAALTGTFSVAAAGVDFVAVSGGGLLVGAGLAIALNLAQVELLRRRFDHASAFLTATVLLPFAAYLAAERLGTSGILAAVAAGLVVRRGRTYGLVAAETRLVVQAVWEVITFTFNGMIFLLLGMQLPQIVRSGAALARRDHVPPWEPFLAVALITLVLLALRLLWIASVVVLRRLAIRWSRAAAPYPPGRIVIALTAAGVRGAVTLAAISSLDAGFPQRDLLVVLAAGVILCSLLLAAAALPALLTGLEAGAETEAEADEARLVLAQVAADSLDKETGRAEGGAERREVVAGLLAEAAARIRRLSFRAAQAAETNPDGERAALLRRERLEVALRLRVLREQRDRLGIMFRRDQINDETERLMMRELDLREENLLSRAAVLPREPEPHGGTGA